MNRGYVQEFVDNFDADQKDAVTENGNPTKLWAIDRTAKPDKGEITWPNSS
jgi:hypothetical protein